MQRFNQSPRSAARSRGTPIRSSRSPPRTPPRTSILDSPSGLSPPNPNRRQISIRPPMTRRQPTTPPRRGILRQPNSILRQATISPTSSRSMPARAPSPPAQELSANERDDIQLDRLQSTIRDLIREDIGLDEADTAINNLQGHQDIKDMFSGVGGMEYVPRVRVLLDILDLIRTKQYALAQAMIEEAEENELAEAETDTGSEAESEPDSDDERHRANLREIFASDDSDDDESRSSSPWQDPLGDNYDRSNAPPPARRRQRPRDSFLFSDDESDSDDEDAEDAEDFVDFLDRMERENAAREGANPVEQSDEEFGYDSDDLASLMDSDDDAAIDIANADTVDVSAQLRF